MLIVISSLQKLKLEFTSRIPNYNLLSRQLSKAAGNKGNLILSRCFEPVGFLAIRAGSSRLPLAWIGQERFSMYIEHI
jgi:hypothetical protein